MIKYYFISFLLCMTGLSLSGQGLISEHIDDNGYYARFGTTGIVSSRLMLNQNTIQPERNILLLPGTVPPPLLLRINPEAGNVTIGDTDAQNAKLTLRADNESQTDLRIEGDGIVSTQGSFYFYVDDNNNANEYFSIKSGGSGEDLFWIGENDDSFLNGNLAIGDPQNVKRAAGFRLSVDGKIMSEEVRVELDGNWPDYVFEHDYELMSLQKLKLSIDELGHLPGIPSAETIEDHGIELGEMNRLLLEKIEELTLHVIDLQEQINLLKDEK